MCDNASFSCCGPTIRVGGELPSNKVAKLLYSPMATVRLHLRVAFMEKKRTAKKNLRYQDKCPKRFGTIGVGLQKHLTQFL